MASFCIAENEKRYINLAFQRYYDLHDANLAINFRSDLINILFHRSSLIQPNENSFEALKFHDYDRRILAESFPYLECKHSKTNELRWIEDPQAFELLKRFISFEEFEDIISPPFKRQLKKISSERRLEWIIKVLIDYHHEHECSLYISLAIKLSLRAFQLFYRNITVRMRSVQGFELQQGYLEIIPKYKCSELFVSATLEVFCVSTEQRMHFLKFVPDLKYVLESIGKTTLRLPFGLNKEGNGRFNCFDLCLIASLQRFIVLVTFGASSIYSKEDWCLFKWRGIEVYEVQLINHDPIVPVYGRCSLRLSQIIYLFKRSKLNQQTCDESTFALKLLWASIHEPYITEEDVTKYLKEDIYMMSVFNINYRFCLNLYHTPEDYPDTIAAEIMYRETFESNTNGIITMPRKLPILEGTPHAATVIQAWQWYRDIVLNRDNPLSSPRSLKQLCRCAIRLNLAMNFLLPRGVYLLHLPDHIRNFLLLKDCGDNPCVREVI